MINTSNFTGIYLMRKGLRLYDTKQRVSYTQTWYKTLREEC